MADILHLAQVAEDEFGNILQTLRQFHQIANVNDHPMVKAFQETRRLGFIEDRKRIAQTFLCPASKQAIPSGIAHQILSSICRLLEAGLISKDDSESDNVYSVMCQELVRFKFESTSLGSEELCLVKILELGLRLFENRTYSDRLGDNMVCQILETMFSAGFRDTHNPILRHCSESILRRVVRIICTKQLDQTMDRPNHRELESVAEKNDQPAPHDHRQSESIFAENGYGEPTILAILEFLTALVDLHSTQNEKARIMGLELIVVVVETLGTLVFEPRFDKARQHMFEQTYKNMFVLVTGQNPVLVAKTTQALTRVFRVQGSESLQGHVELYVRTVVEALKASDDPFRYCVYVESLIQMFRLEDAFIKLYVSSDKDLGSDEAFQGLMRFCVCDVLERVQRAEWNHFESVEILNEFLRVVSNRDLRNVVIDKSHSEMVAKKHRLKQAVKVFNMDCKKGGELFPRAISGLETATIDTLDAKLMDELVVFLRYDIDLDKQKLGEYLSRLENQRILDLFVSKIGFQDCEFIDQALRRLLQGFRLPGESAPIERILEAFVKHHTLSTMFKSKEAAFVLAYSVIMLNTDQHNPNVKKRMTLETFVRNNRGLNDGEDFPEEYLTKIYHNIRQCEIPIPEAGKSEIRNLWNDVVLKERQGKAYDNVDLAQMFELVESELSRMFFQVLDQCLQKGRSVPPSIEECGFLLADSAFSLGRGLLADTMVENLLQTVGFHSLAPLDQMFGDSRVFLKMWNRNSAFQLGIRMVFYISKYHYDILGRGWNKVIRFWTFLFVMDLLSPELTRWDDTEEGGIVERLLPSRGESTSSLFSRFSTYFGGQAPNPGKSRDLDMFQDSLQELKPIEVFNEWRFAHIDTIKILLQSIMENSLDLVDGRDLAMVPVHKELDSTQIRECVGLFYLELEFEILLCNRDRIQNTWDTGFRFIKHMLLDSAARALVSIQEKAVAVLLRLCGRILHNEQMKNELFHAFELVKNLPPDVFENISTRFMRGLDRLITTDSSFLKDKRNWDIVFLLISMTHKDDRTSAHSLNIIASFLDPDFLSHLTFRSQAIVEILDMLGLFVTMENSQLVAQSLGLIFRLYILCTEWDSHHSIEITRRLGEYAGSGHGYSAEALSTLGQCLICHQLGIRDLDRMEQEFQVVLTLIDKPMEEHPLMVRPLPIYTQRAEMLIVLARAILLYTSQCREEQRDWRYMEQLGPVWIRLARQFVQFIETGPDHVSERLLESLKNVLLVLKGDGILELDAENSLLQQFRESMCQVIQLDYPEILEVMDPLKKDGAHPAHQ